MDASTPVPAGLVAVTGDEGSGKTRWLQGLCGLRPQGDGPAAPSDAWPGPQPTARTDALADRQPDALCLDLALPGRDSETAIQVWDALRAHCPRWDAPLHADLVEALGLAPHRDKQLFLLSTGSRRKVAIVGLLAAGATVTCLDQPFAALDAASRRVLREFLADMADHPTRTWVVADYEADPQLAWRQVIRLS